MSPGIVDPEELAKQIAELLSTFSESGPGAEEVKLALLKMRADDYALGEKLYLYGIMKAPFLAGAPLAYLLNYRDSLNGVGPWDIRRVAKKYLASSPYIAAAMGPMLPESASKEMKPAEAPKPSQGAPAGTQERKRQVKAYALENGLRVMLDENPESHVFAVHLLVKNRSVSEPAGKEGIADFLHRLLEKGAADLEENQLNRKLAEIAGTLQVTDNPYIPFDDYYFTGEYSYIRLETIDEFGQEALKLLAHLIQSPRMEESDIAAVAEEMVSVVKRDAGKPSAVAKRLFYENLLPKSPLKNPLLGTETSIASISSADLAAFHKDYFAPDNLILSVVGNAPIEQMEAWVKDAFGKMEKREISPSAERLAPAFSKKGKRAEEKVGKEQSQILIGTLVQMKKLDLPALIVMNEVLSQRLAFNLREKQGLAYSIGSALHIASGGESPWGWIAASMGTRPENIEKAQEGILREMKGMRTGVLSEMELKKAVSRYTGEALRRRLPSMGRAYMLDLDDFFGWPADFSVKILEDMKKLKPEDVKNAARKYLDLDSMTVAVAR
jgi:predicted Zn-dependent peptidase